MSDAMAGADDGGAGVGGRGGGGRRLHGVVLALTDGLVAASFMFFLITALVTPGLEPPPESAALFLVATTAGVIGDRLLRGDGTTGYPAAVGAGLVSLAVVAVIVFGTYGPAGPRTNPVGPVSYVALAGAVTLTAGAAWRSGTTIGGASTSSSTP